MKYRPSEIRLRRKARVLEVTFIDGDHYTLPFEYLRVYSPSAEVKGHGPGQETLLTGKRNVGITAIEPVGNYAIQPHFDDGHTSGIFSWDYLYWLGDEQASLWEDYLRRLQEAGASRDSVADAGDNSTTSTGEPLQAQSVSRPRQ